MHSVPANRAKVPIPPALGAKSSPGRAWQAALSMSRPCHKYVTKIE